VALLDDLVAAHDIAQLKVQVDATLNWDGPSVPVQPLLHLHGDKDRLMPLDRISGAQVVRGGTHFMVYDQAAEVSRLLRAALDALG
jgi:pimeloyl-ACP methyl ester carboxylesterase